MTSFRPRLDGRSGTASRITGRARSASAASRPLPHPNADVLSPEAWIVVASHTRLSAREGQIMRAMFDGLTEHAIASDLGISPHTVHTHLRRLYAKLSVTNRSQAILRIFQTFLVVLRRNPRLNRRAGSSRSPG